MLRDIVAENLLLNFAGTKGARSLKCGLVSSVHRPCPTIMNSKHFHLRNYRALYSRREYTRRR